MCLSLEAFLPMQQAVALFSLPLWRLTFGPPLFGGSPLSVLPFFSFWSSWENWETGRGRELSKRGERRERETGVFSLSVSLSLSLSLSYPRATKEALPGRNTPVKKAIYNLERKMVNFLIMDFIWKTLKKYFLKTFTQNLKKDFSPNFFPINIRSMLNLRLK